jgi:acetyltransferase-like isoleucine patch superfamily enzyme
MKKLFTAFICFFLPARVGYILLNVLGHRVSSRARLGFSLVWIDRLEMAAHSRLGILNLIKVDALVMAERAYFGRLNVLTGGFDVKMAERGSIGNNNTITRPPLGITYGKSVLQLGILAKYTVGHRIDLTRSITLGDYSTLAGKGSQLWTHGYYHERVGAGRFRVDGEIHIGNNVYIGTMCVVNAGVTVADGVTVGSCCCISKPLTKAGIYVSQPLRFIESDPLLVRERLHKVTGYDIEEPVYTK